MIVHWCDPGHFSPTIGIMYMLVDGHYSDVADIFAPVIVSFRRVSILCIIGVNTLV